MIKKSPYGTKYIGSCYKKAFTTKKEAKKVMKRATNPKRKLKTAYQCCKCGFWHLSHLTLKQYKDKVRDYKLIKFLEEDLS
jgi:ribosomal protein L32